MLTTAIEAPYVLKMLAHDLRWRAISALARSDYRVQELVSLLKEPHNVLSYHLRRLRDGKIVQERRSAADARDVYYSLDHSKIRDLYLFAGQSLHPDIHGNEEQESHDNSTTPARKVRVLFLCTHNSARSQMAEGIMRNLAGDRVEVESAGTEVTHVRPEAIETMAALGIDISGQRSKHLNEFLGQHWDYVVTVCDRAKEACPIFPGDPERIHWSFDDPSAVEPEEARREAYAKTARELTVRIRLLVGLIERDQRRKA
ncbi:MAG: ArsR family transcriptional regulator [Chloroflexota bacterium]